MKLAIEVENISKLYRLGVIGMTTLRDSVERWWYKVRGKEEILPKIGAKHLMIEPDDAQAGPEPNTILALRNVSFSVKQGEIVGIIGKNGAGKTTLLKILSRITEPTSGKAIIRGRTSSMLEVGTGFHHELTGRENVYLNGAILGMRKADIDRKFDEIVGFAELEKFIDTPVKRYSSGMYIRLAFAVGAHLEPEILLVDEVLAVGDLAFQKKCLGKMGEVAKGGRTVLFVSHNMFSIQNLCGRVIILDAGRMIMDGEVNEVINRYIGETKQKGGEISWPSPDAAPGDERGRLKAIRIVSNGEITQDVDIDKEFRIEVDYWNLKQGKKIMVSTHIYNGMGLCVLTSGNLPSACIVPDKLVTSPLAQGLFRTSCTIPSFFLNDGLYTISAFVLENNFPSLTAEDHIADAEGALAFNIVDTGAMSKEHTGKWIGVVRPRLMWETTQLSQ